MTTFYHYCSVESLFHILQSRKVRLCDARHMNDHKEVEWAYEEIGRVFTQHDNSSSRDDLVFLWDHLAINKLHPFVFCMSSKPDLLSQWRAYAADGAGVAIGFNEDVFATPTKMPSRSFGKPEVGLWPIIYDSAVQTSQVRKVVLTYLEKCKEGARESAMTEALNLLSGYSTFYKNSAFEEEAEVRLVYTPILMDNEQNLNRTLPNELAVHQRCTANDIYTYFDYELAPKSSNMPLINDIRLGPTCRLSHFDLKYFLSLNGYGAIPINQSSASYRKQ